MQKVDGYKSQNKQKKTKKKQSIIKQMSNDQTQRSETNNILQVKYTD